MLPQIVINEAAGDPPLLVQLAPYLGLAAAGLALVGVWLGKLLERRDTKSHWLLDRRFSEYAQLLDVSHGLWESCVNAYQSPWDEREDHMVIVNGHHQAIGRATTRVNLLGPREVDAVLTAFLEAHHPLVDLVAERALWQAARDAHGLALSQTEQALRLRAADADLRMAMEDVIR